MAAPSYSQWQSTQSNQGLPVRFASQAPDSNASCSPPATTPAVQFVVAVDCRTFLFKTAHHVPHHLHPPCQIPRPAPQPNTTPKAQQQYSPQHKTSASPICPTAAACLASNLTLPSATSSSTGAPPGAVSRRQSCSRTPVATGPWCGLHSCASLATMSPTHGLLAPTQQQKHIELSEPVRYIPCG